MRREGEVLVLEGAVTLDTVPGLAQALAGQAGEGVRVVDFAKVTEVDSSAVALALEWLRQAEQAGRGLRLAHLPAAMQNLARLYGVSEFLQPAA